MKRLTSIMTVLVIMFFMLGCEDIPYVPAPAVPIEYCTYEVWQEGINITQACLDCRRGDSASGVLFYEKTPVTCVPD